MSMPVLLSACVVLVFLGVNSSASLGVQNPEPLSESTNIRDIEPYGSKQNLRSIKVNQEQYIPNEGNGRGNQLGTLSKRYIQKSQAQSEENSIYDLESEEDSSERFIAKRVTQLKNAEGMGFKSRPGFRSWGGKRSKFTNWGGKRNSFSKWGGKRSKFNNWGGKRSHLPFVNLYDSEMKEIFQEEPAAVRLEEGTYGLEKRDPEYPTPYEQGDPMEKYLNYDFLKKDEFQTWAGKRAEKSPNPAMDNNKLSRWTGKRKFSNWAGKRGSSFPETPQDMNRNWILKSQIINSILDMIRTEESEGKKISIGSNSLQDGPDNEETKLYLLDDTR